MKLRAATGAFAVALAALSGSAHAGLFDDDEARRAILEIRQKIDANRLQSERLTEENTQLRRSLLSLQGQIESLTAEQANLRGQNEQLTRTLADVQKRQTDMARGVDERLRQFEPAKVSVDGTEFSANPSEKRDYEAALAVFRQGNFPDAEKAFKGFVAQYPRSGYAPSSYFWLGNAQYANRNYNEAITNFRNLLAQAPDHARAPEAALSIANCQAELKDAKAARKTLEDLVKAYPQSEAAAAAKDRIARMR